MNEMLPSNSYFANLGELLAGAGVSPHRVEALVSEQIKDELQGLEAALIREVGGRLDVEVFEARVRLENEIQHLQHVLEELQLETDLARETARRCASTMRFVVWVMLGHSLLLAFAAAGAFWYLN